MISTTFTLNSSPELNEHTAAPGCSRYTALLRRAGPFNLVGGKVKGTQVSCLYNESGDTVKGLQVSGLVNVAKKVVKGMQIASLVNVAASVQGVQIGLINITGSREGSSIGLINISKGRKTRVGFVLRLPRKERI